MLSRHIGLKGKSLKGREVKGMIKTMVGIGALTLCFTMVGCGGSGAEGSSQADKAEKQLLETAQLHAKAFFTGDGQGLWSMMSTRCQEQIGLDQVLRDADLAGVVYGDEKVKVIKVEKFLADEGRAVISYETTSKDLDVVRNWVREGQGSEWKWDGCP
jgi:hypothetical protein